MQQLHFDINRLTKICQQNHVSKIGIFGSVARGEATSTSDIDVLVYFSRPKRLLSLIKLERELSEAFGRKIDLLTEAAISPYLRDRILNEVQMIYEG